MRLRVPNECVRRDRCVGDWAVENYKLKNGGYGGISMNVVKNT